MNRVNYVGGNVRLHEFTCTYLVVYLKISTCTYLGLLARGLSVLISVYLREFYLYLSQYT